MNFVPLQIETKYAFNILERSKIENYFYDKQDVVGDEDIEKYWEETNGICPDCSKPIRNVYAMIMDATEYVCLGGHWWIRYHRGDGELRRR